MPLSEKIRWAAEEGYTHLEISCWPRVNERDYAGSDLDVNDLSQETISRVKSEFQEAGLSISALASMTIYSIVM